MCLNKLSIGTKIHFRAHNTAFGITNKVRVRPPMQTRKYRVVKLFPSTFLGRK